MILLRKGFKLFMEQKKQAAILLVVSLLLSITTHAQDELYTNGMPGDSLITGKTLTTQDTVFFNTSLKPTIAYTNSVNNIINFSINEFSNTLLPDSFIVTLTVRVIYVDKNNLKDSIPSQDLTINYNKNRAYSNKAILSFQNAYWVQVKLLGITAQYAPVNSILHSLQLENDIDVNRSYLMDCTNDAVQTIGDSISSVATNGELKVYWPSSRVAQQYDLEWAWVDQSVLNAGVYNTSGQPDPNLIFKNNATRVTITGSEYSIPLLYDGDGSLFFRVRGTQVQTSGEVTATSWSSDFISSGGLGRYDFTGHARNLNWQATTSFAEDGKRKSVVQYFDGSLRSRQTVTKDNTTNTTVVAETLYDQQGRPAIQVLPSPTLSSIINYTPMFNVGINGVEYDKGIYDTLESASDYCSGIVPEMDTSSGASQYYSPENPKVDSFYHRFIPNAHGYPFAQTQYTQDNTGRIYRQGGVDNIFQIGMGHETKYYYGSPEQTDLDALFGTEAGDASHYQKNMVRDANGQYSVSYVDMNGKTVATALAGVSPANLQQLNSFSNLTQTDNLLGSNNIINGNTIQSTKSLLVTKAGPQTFTYKMASEALTIQDCDTNNICYDCLYNLNITITDNCNNQLIGGAPIVINKQNFQLFKVDTSCGMVIPMDTSFTYTLPEGEYNITKTLSISRYGMQYYHDSLFMPHNTCRIYQDFLTEQMDSIKNRFDCAQPFDSTATYTNYKQQMLLDLTPPSGQYADTSATILYQNVPYDNSGFSIFNKLDDGTYKYQHPSIPYLDDEGNPDSVQNTSGILVAPEQLSKDEFVANFKDSWANALLDKHPEYHLLQYYDTLSASLKWDDDFQNTNTYADAVAKGYLNPTGNTTQLPASNYTPQNVDPLYGLTAIDAVTGNAIGTEARTKIEDSLFNYSLPPGSGYSTITKWNLATITTKCHDTSGTSCFNTYYPPQNAFDTASLCTGDLDMAWRTFQMFYENTKAAWIDQYIRSQIGSPVINPPYTAVFQQADSIMAAQGYSADGSNINSDTLQGLQNLGQFYQNTCTGYAQAWWDQLAPCNYTSADSAIILPRLIKVCELGSDANHILGSSSISPDSSYRFTSFEDVIKQYNDSAYNGQKNINQCNSYLITRPLPYNQSQLLVNKTLWTKPDSCECSKITNYYNLYSQVAASYINFSDYIQQNLGTIMTEGALDSLRNLCNGTISCTYIPNPINLPPALQCGVSNVCASCLMVQQWNDSFMVKFPGLVPTLTEPDTIQRNTNQLFASYMNYQSGFSYSAQDYLTFMDTCSGIVTDTANCSSLIWTVYNPGTGLNINNDLFNAANNNILPSSQFFSNSIFNGPIETQASDYVLVDKKDSIHTTDSIVIMQWRVKPASISDMVNPVVQTGNNSYVGAQWFRDPADTTWLIGTTRIRVIGGILKGIGLQSNSYGMLTDWVKVISGSTSSVLFFDDFLQSSNCSIAAATGSMLCGKAQALDSMFTNVQTSPCADTTAFAVSTATQIYNAYKDSLSDYFNEAYTSKCLNAINLESFTVTHAVSEYHYTLYYYDQAGNLIKTVPPEGVHPDRDPAWLAQIEAAKANGTVLVPANTLPTIYRYNSLNQVVSQNTPDAGISSFWYDKLGRLAISQNAKQNPLNNYSYTLYDYIGRITEVGQKPQPAAMSNIISRSASSLASWLNFNNGTFDYNAVQVTSTVYDIMSNVTQLTAPVVTANPVTFTQQAYTLRNRVSYTQYYDVLQNNSSVVNGTTIYTPIYGNYTTGTYYAYDIHGNVDTLLQDYRLGTMASHGYNRFKEIAYNYDLISGKVNEVDYQPGAIDQFYHRYEYDAENRLTDVYTSDNKAYVGHKNLEEHEAFYQYYKHGPLSRAIIGQQQVQGLDYAYTLEGWLKGVNSTTLQSAAGTGVLTDMGGDGVAAGPNQFVAQDAYGFNLNYFTGDYSAINSGVSPFPGFSGMMPGSYYKPLYNGNISAMAVNIGKLNAPLLYNYQYDQLNRLVAMDAFTGLNQANNTWSPLTTDNSYQERLSYDANGNIKSYLRNGTGATFNLNNYNYTYQSGSNRLLSIQNSVNSQTSNYDYDAIGNVIKDDKQNVAVNNWNVYGKLQSTQKTDGTNITYTYDAGGNRISKTVSGTNGYTEWYVRDASGNIMGVYNLTGTAITQTEQHIYGSSRLGIFNRNIDADAPLPAGTNANLIGKYYVSFSARGNKRYEFSDQRGSVLLTASDKKMPYSSNGTTIDYYNADIISATDYSTFGAISRSFNGGNVKNAFDGQRLSPEISPSAQTAEFWEYNGDVGRRWNVDKVYKNSPYEAFGGNPILFSDPSGLDTVTESKKAGTNDVFQHQNGSSNFYWDKTAKGWEGGGESGNLPEIRIKARLKKDPEPLVFLSGFNYTREQARQWDIDYANFEKGNNTGLTSSQISFYTRRD
jgi:YD repeat-containing protein